ncbi:MAG: RHS repeat-associated core domain-containing protein, partial [Candidatus Sumerlaeaceae bacterium]|nr:RHS repeat-associated core domain-containing protein [Candidatus Sumerlaeaceae bacterium]
LWVTQHSTPQPATHFAAYDGNGNVVALSAASDGSETARYEYGPFGEPLRMTGPLAEENPLRFSTKRTDHTTDLVLYEYRPYSPSLGRWLSRDPKQERTTVNLHAFCINDSVNRWDLLGLLAPDCPPCDPTFPPRCNPIPAAFATCSVFIELWNRWRNGYGGQYELPDAAMQIYWDSSAVQDEIAQLKRILHLLCRDRRRTSTVVCDSFTTPGSTCEAWYLGGHTRNMSACANCCSKDTLFCLEIWDRWDFDESDPWPSTGDLSAKLKYIGSICTGAILNFPNPTWSYVSVPVHGKLCRKGKL